MKVLAFDVSKKSTGWAFSTELGIEDGGSFPCKDVVFAYDKFVELIDLWKPDVVISASPVRYFDAIVTMSRLYGILLYICLKRGIKPYEEKGRLVNDKTMKKAILGSGNATKADIMKHFNCDNEDQADAMLFTQYALLKLKNHA